jgi:hypothetical protein
VQLLLGYLPTERSLWPYELEKKRSQYSAYKDEFLLNPVSSDLPLSVISFKDIFTLGYLWYQLS